MSFLDKVFPKTEITGGSPSSTPKPPSQHVAKFKAKFSRSKTPQAIEPTIESSAVPTPAVAQTPSGQEITQPAAAAATPTAQTQPPATGVSTKELTKRRDALASERREMQWNLGGLVYEMSIRDHFRLDVVVARAAKLQETDAQLAEVERMLRMDAQGAAGNCPECSAVYSRGAVFCWQCGHQLLERSASTAVPSPS